MTRRLPLLAVVLALAAPGSAAAQGQQHPAAPSPTPSILQGQNKDQPIQIESATL
jgi:hypothetical protein